MPLLAKRLVRLYVGLFLFATGLIMVVNSRLGLSSWNCLNDGISKHTPITFGQANILVGLAIVTVVFFCKEKIGLGTLSNMLCVGLFLDFWRAVPWMPKAAGLWDGLLFIFAGQVVMAFGSFVYLSAGFGAGPRDGLMLSLMKLTGKPLAVCRAFSEACALLGGFLLGGAIGVGTVVATFTNGPTMQFVFKKIGFNPRAVQHEYLDDQLRRLLHRQAPQHGMEKEG